MDRSFLSQPTVIAASRAFVCVRLATYENATEAALLKTITSTRSGELENSVFTILSPDGKRQLVRGARSPRQDFDDAADMAATMNRLAAAFAAKQSTAGVPELPLVASVRLALDVAACDNQPLVLVYVANAADRRAVEERLRPLAWDERFLGHFVFAGTTTANDLAAVSGAKPGVLVVEPDSYGQKGKVLARADANATEEELARLLADGLTHHQQSERTFANHVREGHRLGVFWETAIPVTDPQERNARERGKAMRQSP